MNIISKTQLHATVSALLTVTPILLGFFISPLMILLAPVVLALCYWHFKITILIKIKE